MDKQRAETDYWVLLYVMRRWCHETFHAICNQYREQLRTLLNIFHLGDALNCAKKIKPTAVCLWSSLRYKSRQTQSSEDVSIYKKSCCEKFFVVQLLTFVNRRSFEVWILFIAKLWVILGNNFSDSTETIVLGYIHNQKNEMHNNQSRR